MPKFYQESPAEAFKIKGLYHSAAAGGRIPSALTLRQSGPANSALNRAWFSAITPSMMAGQVKRASSCRL